MPAKARGSCEDDSSDVIVSSASESSTRVSDSSSSWVRDMYPGVFPSSSSSFTTGSTASSDESSSDSEFDSAREESSETDESPDSAGFRPSSARPGSLAKKSDRVPPGTSDLKLNDDELERLKKATLEKKQRQHRKGKAVREAAQQVVGKLNDVPIRIAQGAQDLYNDAAKKISTLRYDSESESGGVRVRAKRAKRATAKKARKAEMKLLGKVGVTTWDQARIYAAMPATVRRHFTPKACAKNMRIFDNGDEVNPDWLEVVLAAAGPGVDPLAWLRVRLRTMQEGWHPGSRPSSLDEAEFATRIKYFIPFKLSTASVKELRQGISDTDKLEGYANLDETKRLTLAYIEGAYSVFQGSEARRAGPY
jgi:hypothetical protein